MNFVFLDDNTAFLEEIKNAVYNKYEDFKFEYFSNTEKFIEYVTHNSDKLSGVFIDIVLDNTNGMEIARQVNKINSDIKIVFVTGYVKEYCQNIFLNDYSVTPFAFLTKPLQENVLYKIFDKFKEEEKRIPEDSILVKTPDGFLYVKPSEICYLESQGRMIKFCLTNKTVFEVYGKINDYANNLKNFCHPHKSYLVNTNCIKKFDSSEIEMTNGEKVPISQRYQKQFKDELLLNRGKKQTVEVV